MRVNFAVTYLFTHALVVRAGMAIMLFLKLMVWKTGTRQAALRRNFLLEQRIYFSTLKEIPCILAETINMHGGSLLLLHDVKM